MIVFRITAHQWNKELKASGYPARWNLRGDSIIYTAESRSLACLENLVHRSGEGDNNLYKVMVIEIPETVKIDIIGVSSLQKYWYTIDNYNYCQHIGSKWLSENQTAVLKVPSVIIKKEANYLINPNHPDFQKIELAGNEDFDFDSRF